MQNLVSESIEKGQADDILIKGLESEKDELITKLETLNTQLKNKDISADEYHETQLNLQKLLEKREEEITTLSENLKKGFQSFQEEKKSILEQLDTSEQ